MKKENAIIWKSPLMQISSVDIRRSKETEKDYAVVKVYSRQFPKPGRARTVFRKGKKTTFLCFKDALFPLFLVDSFHMFEGEISFDWGSTYLCITKLFDGNGNRLLRSSEIIAAGFFHEELSKAIGENIGEYITRKAEEKQEKGIDCPHGDNSEVSCESCTEDCIPF